MEAKALFALLGRNGDTEESLLELIRIAPQDQALLRNCAADCLGLAAHIERALQYRLRVEKEFRALCRRQDHGHCIIAQGSGVLPEVLVDTSTVQMVEIAGRRRE
jgi:hypothetical protein